ncbi:MAG: type IV pilus twitching motility protein PilT, partial [Acidobacteria bacterium]|nr:type IV pilus twitching motility protein PilT [Acidobacteriota bacterium]
MAITLDALLRTATEAGASDLHVKAGSYPMMRVHGTLLPASEERRLEREDTETMVAAVLSPAQHEKFKERLDLDLAYSVPGLGRFRCNVFQQRGTYGLVLRIISTKVHTIDELGLPPVLKTVAEEERGLVLVTGTTGSGKSTTLAAMIDHVNNTRSAHIMTVEDPIEYLHRDHRSIVNQREVTVDTMGFAPALRAALRQDPDVILVGEMRDLETVSIAIETAETGHLVFGTLHTTTAASTIDRIIDQFPADRQAQVLVMLSESLRGVIAQTLCKKIGGGRVAAREVLLSIPAVSNLIREGKTFQIPSIIQTNRRTGMVT